MPLLLDLLRHGVAAPDHPLGDDHRVLTSEGVRAIEDLARRLEAIPGRPEHIFTSPLARARQTAALVSRAWSDAPACEVLADLEPDRDPAALLVALRDRGIQGGHVLLVGHQPLLGRLALHLTGAEQRFSPGTLIRVECADGAPRPPARMLLALHSHDR